MSKIVSYMDQSIEYVHAANCSRGKRDAKMAHSPLYPAPDNTRDLVIQTFADIWSDEYDSTEDAIAAGEVESYAQYVHVSPCATTAGFRDTI